MTETVRPWRADPYVAPRKVFALLIVDWCNYSGPLRVVRTHRAYSPREWLWWVR